MVKQIKMFLLKEQMAKHNIEIVDISERALGKYRCKIKGNDKESIDTCIHKLIRNYNVGSVFYEDDYIIKKAYGNLTMVYHKRENKIINVYNHYGVVRHEIDLDRKELVEEILGMANGTLEVND